MESKVSSLWQEMKVMMESMEKDIEKNSSKHNVSAGLRVRKTLKLLKKHCAALAKEMIALDKSTVAERKEENSK